MVRISGVILPENKKLAVGLANVYGIGRLRAFKALRRAEIDFGKRVKELTSEEIVRLQKVIDEMPVEGVLKKRVSQDIQRLRSINSYRGLRHSLGLPARGQRTRSNARTKRGKRITIGAMKKEALARLEAGKKKKETTKSG
jgi:small subunit ribosomal protein S13